MRVIPAIDIRDGACVQLVGGSYAAEVVREPDPVAAAARWRRLGFTHLHVVDLDAATGAGSNAAVVERLSGGGGTVQVGGGLRTSADVASVLARGATAAVVGTRAVEDRAWLFAQCMAHPDRIIVAVDVRGGRIAVRGWAAAIDTPVAELLASLEGLPLAGVLVTSVDVEGRMAGPDFALVCDARRLTAHPLIASGGVGSLEDLRALRDHGADAVVVGMALYTGALDARAVAMEFTA